MELTLHVLGPTFVVATTISAWLWLEAAGKIPRKVSQFADFNHADLNRLVSALNGARSLNAGAAVATAIAALLGGLRIGSDLLP